MTGVILMWWNVLCHLCYLTLGDIVKCVFDYSHFMLCIYMYDNEWMITGIVSENETLL